MPTLTGIYVYPVKSLPAVSPSEVRIVAGALENDRRFAMYDGQGKVVNGKRTDRIHSVRLHSDPFSSRDIVERDLSEHFLFTIHLRENENGGFPDDSSASGPTIVSTATLMTVASWFPGLTIEDVRRRFRANLEIDGVPPFWEDRLFGEPKTMVPFRIGDVVLFGVNPCERCVVPSRDPASGELLSGFQRIFRERREQTLPPWSPRAQFDHFYRLAVNTLVEASENGKTLRLGDPIELIA